MTEIETAEIEDLKSGTSSQEETLTLKKIIEKLREMKSDLDGAFEEGRIDLDYVSAGLEEAAAGLESLEKSLSAEKTISRDRLPSGSSLIAQPKTETIEVADYT